MRKLISILIMLPVAASAQPGRFSITGKTAIAGTGKIFLRCYQGDKAILTDSTLLINGAFHFNGQVPGPVAAEIFRKPFDMAEYDQGIRPDTRLFYMQDEKVTFTSPDSLMHAVITGSSLNNEYERYISAFDAQTKGIEDTLMATFRAIPVDKHRDPVVMAPWRRRFAELNLERKNIKRRYILENPGSYFSLMAIQETVGNPGNPENFNYTDARQLFNMLASDVRGTPGGRAFDSLLNSEGRLATGAVAPDFVQPDAENRPVSLKSFRGKYVLVDFWASWCKPCRAENPNLVNAFNEFKDKNFTILSISLDKPDAKKNWLAAVEKDGLKWTQVSDLRYWDNDAARLYAVKYIPQNVLVDPDGRIVARNLRGEELQKKLSELLSR